MLPSAALSVHPVVTAHAGPDSPTAELGAAHQQPSLAAPHLAGRHWQPPNQRPGVVAAHLPASQIFACLLRTSDPGP